MTLSQPEKERLVQTLQEDPVFLAQVGSPILPAELVQLPERFAQFASHVMAFIERQEQFNADVSAFIQRQEETNAAVSGRLQRITDDLGNLKGHVAGRIAREMADDIAEHLGYEITHQLNGNDLRQMLRQQVPTDIPAGVHRRLYVADLVASVQDEEGNDLYIAVEASHTAGERDTQCAVRNAELITRFTGRGAVPVVANLDNDHAVQQLVDDGAVR